MDLEIPLFVQQPLDIDSTENQVAGNQSVADLVKEAQAKLAKAEQLARQEAKKAARYPWQDPDVQESLKVTGYNFKMSEAMNKKIKWYLNQVPGGTSIQRLLEDSVNNMIDDFVAKKEKAGI
ncbi:hypothetical protein [Cupriavidus pinatubonensis]|uniref:hypothetical protein n=1 Tax=Cupriavidus pinatubonensis TaxID=248026 RepID=UPI001126F933|nr:hypothetical protein [Cupriavidus pinatubonensis]TPQ31822.1 hypothetical protein C2U69_27685 [Cupriavidus pinatubonensis]